MRVTGFWTAVGALIFGVMVADLVANPAGTKTLTSAATSIEQTSVNGLLGKAS
jgi:hypothetical protein